MGGARDSIGSAGFDPIGEGKKAVDPRVVPGFEGLAQALGPLLGNIQQSASPFQAGGAMSASNIFGSPLFTSQVGNALGTQNAVQSSGAFQNALGGLNEAIGGDLGSGITSGLLSEFNELQRPGLDLAKQFAEADIFEGAARSGTTRSTGTTETLGRAFAGIEAGGQQNTANFASAVAPSAIGAQMGAIGQGLGLPGQTQGLFAGPMAQLLNQSQFQQGQAGSAFGDILAGIPIQEGRLSGKQSGGSGGGIGSAIGGMFCWVAREIYGTEDTRWVHLRDYLIENAPEDFLEFYATHGMDIAKQIRDDPEFKARIKVLMDEALERVA